MLSVAALESAITVVCVPDIPSGTAIGDVHESPGVLHVPVWQVCPIGQTLPHIPQLFESVLRLKHAVPQNVVPGAHAIPQRPAMHD